MDSPLIRTCCAPLSKSAIGSSSRPSTIIFSPTSPRARLVSTRSATTSAEVQKAVSRAHRTASASHRAAHHELVRLFLISIGGRSSRMVVPSRGSGAAEEGPQVTAEYQPVKNLRDVAGRGGRVTHHAHVRVDALEKGRSAALRNCRGPRAGRRDLHLSVVAAGRFASHRAQTRLGAGSAAHPRGQIGLGDFGPTLAARHGCRPRLVAGGELAFLRVCHHVVEKQHAQEEDDEHRDGDRRFDERGASLARSPAPVCELVAQGRRTGMRPSQTGGSHCEGAAPSSHSRACRNTPHQSMKYVVVVANTRRVGFPAYRDGSVPARTPRGNRTSAEGRKSPRFALANAGQTTLDGVDDSVFGAQTVPIESGYVAEHLLDDALCAQGIVESELPHLQRVELERMVTS